jgi:hypothetical protein
MKVEVKIILQFILIVWQIIGTISQQAVVHPWLAADAHINKQWQIIMIANTPNGLSSTSEKKQSTVSRMLNSYNGPAK